VADRGAPHAAARRADSAGCQAPPGPGPGASATIPGAASLPGPSGCKAVRPPGTPLRVSRPETSRRAQNVHFKTPSHMRRILSQSLTRYLHIFQSLNPSPLGCPTLRYAPHLGRATAALPFLERHFLSTDPPPSAGRNSSTLFCGMI